MKIFWNNEDRNLLFSLLNSPNLETLFSEFNAKATSKRTPGALAFQLGTLVTLGFVSEGPLKEEIIKFRRKASETARTNPVFQERLRQKKEKKLKERKRQTDGLINTAQACNLAGVRREALRLWVLKGKVSVTKVAGQNYYNPGEIQAAKPAAPMPQECFPKKYMDSNFKPEDVDSGYRAPTSAPDRREQILQAVASGSLSLSEGLFLLKSVQ